MKKKAGGFPLLVVATLCVFGVVGCSKSETQSPKEMAEETVENAAKHEMPDWLLRGGDINRASMMSEWAPLSKDDRLASSADLVSMQLRHNDQPIPEPAELEALSRKLEAKLSEISAEGSRNNELVGNVVDDVWPTIQ